VVYANSGTIADFGLALVSGGAMLRLATGLIVVPFFLGAYAGEPENPVLTLVTSGETAPAGGWTQIKVYASPPRQVTAGSLSMDFDPSVFGSIANVAVFSSTGDAAGYAHVSGRHVDAHFTSPSGGIGQLPGLPLFVVDIPVLSALPNGTNTRVTLDSPASAWKDTEGTAYSVVVAPATFRVGGSISVQSVTPGGGVLTQGTSLEVTGSGFDSSVRVAIDGVSISSIQVFEPQRIGLTLGAPQEMTGKHLRLRNSSGEQVDYFLSLPSAPSDWQSPIYPLLPLTTFQTVQWYTPTAHPTALEYLALLNPNLVPVTVTFFGVSLDSTYFPPAILKTIVVPPGELYFPDAFRIGGPQLYMTASAPIRLLTYTSYFESSATSRQESTFPPIVVTSLPDSVFFERAAGLSPGPITWNWQIGSFPPPPATTLALNGHFDFTVSTAGSAQQWLTATPTQGTAPAAVTLTPNVTSLGPGTYNGSVSMTSPLPEFLSGVFPAPMQSVQVVLNVSNSPFLSASGPAGNPEVIFTNVVGGSSPQAQTVTVQCCGDFTATAATNTGGVWLAVTPDRGTAPASLTLTANAAGLAYGRYSGQVVIRGPANTVVMPVTLNINSLANPPSLSFVLAAGVSTSSLDGSSQTEVFAKGSVASFSTQTDSGGNWLSVARDSSFPSGLDQLIVNASAVSLGAGLYRGTITVNLTAGGSTLIPVVLTVLAAPTAALTVSPPSLSFNGAVGQTMVQSLSVNSGSAPALFAWTTGGYVSASLMASAAASTPFPTSIAPATLQVQASANQPGTYYTAVVISWDGGALTVPVTLSIAPVPSSPPVLSSIVNAASEASNSIAPGELVSLLGMGIGSTPTGLAVDAAGKISTELNCTQVLINDTPVPLTYVSAGQVNAIVPYEVGSSGVATLRVTCNGLTSATWGVPVAPSAPAIFTIGSAGVGQAAALNQDNSINGASNPAVSGTVIQLFASGGGQTAPPSVTGTLAKTGDATLLPVTVTIGGVDAPVRYHGSGPGQIAGLLQVNAMVPSGLVAGMAPVVITVGGEQSQPGVNIAVGALK
jgi:uncharacterized protein (TIGR03437 family)